MALNKAVIAALKALSYMEFDLRENYVHERQLREAVRSPKFKLRDESCDISLVLSDREVRARVYRPCDREESRPIIIFFHGGGWVFGSIETYDRLCQNLSRAFDRVVMSVDYRLAPENRFPRGLEDCFAFTDAVILSSERFGVTPDQITLAGDSAGGNLAAAVSLMLRDTGRFVPKKQILIYPATYPTHDDDGPFPSVRENGRDYLLTSKRIRDYMNLYVSAPEDYYNPYFAPLIAPDLSRQPETLVITAQYDPLRDEGEAYGRALECAGNRVVIHRVEDAIHGFISLPPFYSQVREAFDVIRGFLTEPEFEAYPVKRPFILKKLAGGK